jgi:hypothetical protein
MLNLRICKTTFAKRRNENIPGSWPIEEKVEMADQKGLKSGFNENDLDML